MHCPGALWPYPGGGRVEIGAGKLTTEANQEEDITKKAVKAFAAIVAVAAVLLLAYAVLSAEPAPDTDNHPGMWDGGATYSSSEISMIIIASALIAVSLAFVLLKEEYEPLPPSMVPPDTPPPPPAAAPSLAHVSSEEAAEEEVLSLEERELSEGERARETYLILRLLTGDERLMFKALMDAGGEALQKDLIRTTKMSNAKVSRVLERLAEKGVISKERWGATNKIRIRLAG